MVVVVRVIVRRGQRVAADRLALLVDDDVLVRGFDVELLQQIVDSFELTGVQHQAGPPPAVQHLGDLQVAREDKHTLAVARLIPLEIQGTVRELAEVREVHVLVILHVDVQQVGDFFGLARACIQNQQLVAVIAFGGIEHVLIRAEPIQALQVASVGVAGRAVVRRNLHDFLVAVDGIQVVCAVLDHICVEHVVIVHIDFSSVQRLVSAAVLADAHAVLERLQGLGLLRAAAQSHDLLVADFDLTLIVVDSPLLRRLPAFLDGDAIVGLREHIEFVILLQVDQVVFLGAQIDAIGQFAGFQIDLMGEQVHGFRRGADRLGLDRVDHEHGRVGTVCGGDDRIGVHLLPGFQSREVDHLRFVHCRRPDAERILPVIGGLAGTAIVGIAAGARIAVGAGHYVGNHCAAVPPPVGGVVVADEVGHGDFADRFFAFDLRRGLLLRFLRRCISRVAGLRGARGRVLPAVKDEECGNSADDDRHDDDGRDDGDDDLALLALRGRKWWLLAGLGLRPGLTLGCAAAVIRGARWLRDRRQRPRTGYCVRSEAGRGCTGLRHLRPATGRCGDTACDRNAAVCAEHRSRWNFITTSSASGHHHPLSLRYDNHNQFEGF
ncbi:unknown [Bifidobacterium bifidum CAG:234]|nr:unknown [Bifidobacterium bifidum CAG:234]